MEPVNPYEFDPTIVPSLTQEERDAYGRAFGRWLSQKERDALRAPNIPSQGVRLSEKDEADLRSLAEAKGVCFDTMVQRMEDSWVIVDSAEVKLKKGSPEDSVTQFQEGVPEGLRFMIHLEAIKRERKKQSVVEQYSRDDKARD